MEQLHLPQRIKYFIDLVLALYVKGNFMLETIFMSVTWVYFSVKSPVLW